MRWDTPSFVEVKMDAEISSYQDDFRDQDIQKICDPATKTVVAAVPPEQS
jgi:hypothetical protein